jgi:hypothetical protein
MTEITKLKKNQLFIMSFLLFATVIENLLSIENQIFDRLKCSFSCPFCHPFGQLPGMGRTTHPTLPVPLDVCKNIKKYKLHLLMLKMNCYFCNTVHEAL